MPGKCFFCDESVVEREAGFGGKYSGACAQCRDEYESPPRHVDTCENPECSVCLDYREEFGT